MCAFAHSVFATRAAKASSLGVRREGWQHDLHIACEVLAGMLGAPYARSRPMRSGDFLGDLGERRVVFPGIFEPVLSDRDGIGAAAPFADKTRTGLETEAWCGTNPAICPQGLGHGLQFSAGRFAQAALRDLLKSVTKSKNKEIAADPRRLLVIEPPPFPPQSLKVERANTIDLALDRSYGARILPISPRIFGFGIAGIATEFP